MPLFLDSTGLSKLLQKIKTVFATKTELTALGDDLAAQANELGKTFVHKTGDETISGTKTFSATIAGSINGNAATASTLQCFTSTAMPAGNLSIDGLQAYGVYNNSGYPTTYGNVINVQGSQFKGAGQLMLGWSGTTNGVANIYYRNKRDNQTTWSAWKTVAFTDSSSDRRVKQDFADIDDAILDAWGEVKWTAFRMKKEARASEKAPVHFGAVVQDIQDAFSAHGVDPEGYALMYREIFPGGENVPSEDDPSLMEMDKWHLRYIEALCIEAAYQRRRADRLEARITALEAKGE